MDNYYALESSDFGKHSRVEFEFVETNEELNQVVAREVVDLIKEKRARGGKAVVILPVGPLDYQALAELCNRERVSCESLVILSMDEYCDAQGRPISQDHPLSFRAFYRRSLLDRLDRENRLPPDQLILPDPADLGHVGRTIARYGGVDICYGGMGINGHFAFNSPPREPMTLEQFRETSVRLVEPREADVAQMAIGGTGGNLEVIPPRACTLGMKELLGARRLHLTFMRSWHAGVLRRALFGPVTPAFPGSLVQTHPRVKATITRLAAQRPMLSVLQTLVK